MTTPAKLQFQESGEYWGTSPYIIQLYEDFVFTGSNTCDCLDCAAMVASKSAVTPVLARWKGRLAASSYHSSRCVRCSWIKALNARVFVGCDGWTRELMRTPASYPQQYQTRLLGCANGYTAGDRHLSLTMQGAAV